MGTPLCIPDRFEKGNNFSDFLFAFMEDEALPILGPVLQIRRGKLDNFRDNFHGTTLKYMLLAILRAVSRRFY